MKNNVTIEKSELEQRVFARDNLRKIMEEEGWKIVEEVFNRARNDLKEEMVSKKFRDISEVNSIQKTIKKIDEIWDEIHNVIDEGDEAIKTLDEKYEKY